ncbi:MAG: hypothetical protein ACHQ0J_02655 [Candidatus Dormibacterales bacterium]
MGLARVLAPMTLAGVAVGLVFATPVAADTSSATSYRQAVETAYGDIRSAAPNDPGPAARALADLQSGVGRSQPEISADLTRRPPDYTDAQSRLLALLAALGQPAQTADPAVARQRLHDVLSMSRYDALHRAPSPLDRLRQWIQDRIAELLRAVLGGAGAPPIPLWYLAALGAVVVIVVAVVVFRSTRGRLGEVVSAAAPLGPRPPADYFAEADHLSAAGDRVGAIRALCAGVAATLAGERTWEGSPLTVREIFQRAPEAERLRPLLIPFEAAVYGGRGVDSPTYDAAARVAAPFRKPAEVAA